MKSWSILLGTLFLSRTDLSLAFQATDSSLPRLLNTPTTRQTKTTGTPGSARTIAQTQGKKFGPGSSSLRALPPVAEYGDLLQHISVTTSQVLADAAVATTPEPPSGWWGAYLGLFKGSLLFVHNTIDGPLRSAGFEQTWGVSILLFTVMIRSLLIPLSLQQSKSAEYQKVLKPYTNEIKQRYKNNQDAQNRAVAKLYEDANQNPLGGCLLALAQIPVFLGLYRGVRLLALDSELQEPFLWIPSLEGPVGPPNFQGLDWLLAGWSQVDGMPTPSMGWETTLAFLAMPIILVLLQSTTLGLLQPPPDENATEEERKQLESTQAIFKFLPLLIGFFSLQVPAGLTLYWFASNIFTVSQSLAVRAYFAANPPEIKLPDYWDAALDESKSFEEMTPAERRTAAQAGLQVGPSMDDMIDESRFHVHVERQPFRETTAAWERVSADSASRTIPMLMEEWVREVEEAVAAVEMKETATQEA